MKINTHNPLRFWAKTSGIALIIMAIAAGFAYGVSFNQLYVPGNPDLTSATIEANYALFLFGGLTWVLILITDLIVSYGLYRYLKPFHYKLALSSGLIRLIYSLFLAVAILYLFNKDLERFNEVWSLGLIVFGCHLTITGIATYYDSNAPKLLGLLLIIAGISYTLIGGLENFIPQAQAFTGSLEKILMLPMTLGELSFAIWLLARGGKTPNQQPSNVPVQDAP